MRALIFILVLGLLYFDGHSQRKRRQVSSQTTTAIDPSVFSNVRLRNLSAGNTGGRITDVAIHPVNKNIRYVAVASGGVWKTKNRGTTWQPIFDNEGSYSIGIVVIDQKNPNIIWVGTGENNAQRSVSRGDGVYKSEDGGKSWINTGLKSSEHIGKIVIDPNDSEVVYVAAQGSVWMPGGDRGLFKTSDGGKTWKKILNVSEDTGISDVIIDPRNPNNIIASAYQRRRHFGMLVAGGPEGGAFRSTDGGQSWKKMSNGFPQGELGRIGLARSPQQPDILYAIVAGTKNNEGIYRSPDNGISWQLMNKYHIVDAQYYMEIFPDPHQFDRIYIIDMMTKVSDDGGKTLNAINHRRLHVDNHEMEFDLDDPSYILIAGDGGVYESWDRGAHWDFVSNIPIAQFYRVGIDNAKPFYNVYGGTQDNNTVGAPNQTMHSYGIKNSDWFITNGGDGFQTRVDPTDPNTIYSMSQYAGIVRYNKQSGESIEIKPLPKAGEPPLRWNWDAPLVLSNFDHSTLYFAANKLFKSTDRGNSWEVLSGDLTRQIDRNKMAVMGKVWGIDAVFKNVWTSPYGTIVALAESPLKAGLLYVGTDDGLIQVTEDDGKTWKKIEGINGVPERAYLSDIHASPHNENTVFAVFNYHKYGDYTPYFFRSDDKGISWKNISANIPLGDFGWTIMQDHKLANLLFAGTEYGMYFSLDAGEQWIKFRSGIPTIAIRDIEIQQDEDDLVAASFGRGFYILDDFSFLREISPKLIQSEAHLFNIKEAKSYIVDNPDGYSLGSEFYSSENPEFGAIFRYYLKEGTLTSEGKRLKEETKLSSAGKPIPYPDWDSYNNEQWESSPKVVFTISNEQGDIIARVNGADKKGMNKVAWNLRHAGMQGRTDGPLVSPGIYNVSMNRLIDGKWQDMDLSQSFKVVPLLEATLENERADVEEFNLHVLRLARSVRTANELLNNSVKAIEKAQDIALSKSKETDLIERAEFVRKELLQLEIDLNGNDFVVDKMELTPPSIGARINRVRRGSWSNTMKPTMTQLESIKIAESEYKDWIYRFNQTNNKIQDLANSFKSMDILIDAGHLDLEWE